MMKGIRTSIRTYIITGLLIIIPIWGTYLILKTLLSTMEGILGRLLEQHSTFYIPGLGIVALLALLLLTGMLATNFLGKRVVKFWDNLLHRVPLVRRIYSLLKAIVDTISIQSKGQFNRVVLIQYPRKGVYSLAFVTGVSQGEVQALTRERLVNVFVPTTPNPTSGFFLMVPEQDIIPLSMSVEDGMKMVISGGLFTPGEVGKARSGFGESQVEAVGENRL